MKNLLTTIGFIIVCGLSVHGQTQIVDTAYSPFYNAYLKYGSGNIIPAYYKNVCTLLKLPPVDNCLDSFSIRLWTSSMEGFRLITLIQDDNSFEGHSYFYLSDTSIKEQKIRPIISLNAFLDSLRVINFNSLIPQNHIENFQDDVADGVTYTLEVVDKGSYNIVTYHAPEFFHDVDNQKFYRILKLLDKYFHFN
jgi:hypothetical protein